MLLPLEISPLQQVSAASNCDNGDFVTPKWNKTVERLAKIPNVYDYDNEYLDDDGPRAGKGQRGENQDPVEPTAYDGPEESWMTWEPNNDLNLLSSYHCSRYNTQTRRLTVEMFEEVFENARNIVDRMPQ